MCNKKTNRNLSLKTKIIVIFDKKFEYVSKNLLYTYIEFYCYYDSRVATSSNRE